jgi:hypothetical protein
MSTNVSPPVAGTSRPLMNRPYAGRMRARSRASGADAYSHGIAWPSPSPQEAGPFSPVQPRGATARSSVCSGAMVVVMAPKYAPGARRDPASRMLATMSVERGEG